MTALRRSGHNDQRDTQAYIQGLLVDEATQGLSEQQSAELDLMVERADLPATERNAWALTAAVCELAFAAETEESPSEPPAPASRPLPLADDAPVVDLPQTMEDRLSALVRQAARDPNALLLKSADSGNKVLQFSQRISAPTASEEPSAATAEPARNTGGFVPWLVAAAAVLVAVGSWTRSSSSAEPADALAAGEPQLAESAAGPLTVAAPADQVVLTFDATADDAAAGASGEVTWSVAEQAGSMRISGLAVNDPTIEQYQLWIFDGARDERFPVDGGVFDVTAEAVTVPIDAKVAVTDATLFAVTVERPGGVVVSSRERIVLTAFASV